jgi:tetratricopeptide (TPR) repeat protein
MRWGNGVGKWWVILAVGVTLAVTVLFIAERDQTRSAAERAFAKAERLAAQQRADSLRQAVVKYEEAARLYRRLGERGKEAVCLAWIGFLSHQLGDRRKALEYLSRALAIFRDVGNRAREFRTLIYMMRLVNDDLGEKQNPRRR